MKHPTSRSWTPEDIEKLRHFVETGVSPARTAAHFKRSMVSVQARARQEGFPDRRYLQREGEPYRCVSVRFAPLSLKFSFRFRRHVPGAVGATHRPSFFYPPRRPVELLSDPAVEDRR
ncbi:hypothetical protein V1291_002602 [Nitrobacteraceae bacterium AZCC 1564]